MPQPIIDIRHLSKAFGKVKALDDISLSIQQGEIFGLTGADGSGKTTLEKIIGTLCPYDSGSCRVMGYDVRKEKFEIRKAIGIVHASFPLYEDLTVNEHIKFHASLFGVEGKLDDPVIAPVYRLLAPFGDRKAGKLSGGMKQKLALCCALIHLPRLLLLDEPTTGVDAISRLELWELLDELNKKSGITIIVSTPYSAEIRKCGRVARMEHGKITLIGTPDEMLSGDDTLRGTGRDERGLGDGGAITVSHLTKKFGDFTAVNDISFDVRHGEVFGFLGTNGAGKTTTIQMLCGLLSPTSGKATVAGCDIMTQKDKIKHHIGYMSQKMSLYPTLSVKENLMFFAGIHAISRKTASEVVERHLEKMGLGGMSGRILRTLPLGWKQRIAFAAATLHNPEVVFLDEPTSGVDIEARRQMWETITAEAARGTAVFVTTHNMDEAMYCDRQSIMVDGEIRAMGKLDEQVRSGQEPDFFAVFDKISGQRGR